MSSGRVARRSTALHRGHRGVGRVPDHQDPGVRAPPDPEPAGGNGTAASAASTAVRRDPLRDRAHPPSAGPGHAMHAGFVHRRTDRDRQIAAGPGSGRRGSFGHALGDDGVEGGQRGIVVRRRGGSTSDARRICCPELSLGYGRFP